MKTIDLYLVLTSYTLTVAVAVLAEFLTRRTYRLLIPAGVAILVLVANTIVGAHLDPDTTYLGTLGYLIAERDTSSIAAILMGAAAGFVWFTRYFQREPPVTDSLWLRIEPTLLAASIGCVVLCGQAFIWKELLGITRHAVSVSAPEFTIEKVADLDDDPLRIAAGDDGAIYVCYDYFKKHGAWGGAVLRFTENPETGKFEKKTVIESPILARCYGLLVRDGDLYVSRSGFYPKTFMGHVTYERTGAVTRLRDLDADGYYEYAHDVITGLPGVRAPDTMQQNNGMAFAVDGSLFITNASAADRTLDEHPWGGSILRYNPDFTGPEIFAKGFRNPWSLAFGPDNELFVTDNDVNRSPGDEINHVISGEHYGHPFVIPNEKGVRAVGFREPILVGGPETVLLGMVYATSPNLPEAYRDCMYVTDFPHGRVLRLRLARKDDTYEVVETSTFASIPSPVDMTISPSGDFFVISRRAKKLYRIRPRKSAGK